jgi:predicted alpha/beta superfamily hydrolase
MLWKFLALTLLFSLSAIASAFRPLMHGWFSQELGNHRDVYIYLPAEYYFRPADCFSVLYMHDGQNLFDPRRAYLGQTWDAQETLNRMIRNGEIPPIIVVALDNSAQRILEYTPDYDPKRQQGGKGDAYLNFVVNEVKPLIDRKFRTRTDRAHTAIMGSSLGGLISIYAGAKHALTFGLVGALSPSIWWNQESIFKLVRDETLPLRLYLDMGTQGGENPEALIQLANQYQQSGMSDNLLLNIHPGAYHSEKFWSQRLPVALKFLFADSTYSSRKCL